MSVMKKVVRQRPRLGREEHDQPKYESLFSEDVHQVHVNLKDKQSGEEAAAIQRLLEAAGTVESNARKNLERMRLRASEFLQRQGIDPSDAEAHPDSIPAEPRTAEWHAAKVLNHIRGAEGGIEHEHLWRAVDEAMLATRYYLQFAFQADGLELAALVGRELLSNRGTKPKHPIWQYSELYCKSCDTLDREHPSRSVAKIRAQAARDLCERFDLGEPPGDRTLRELWKR